MVLDPILLPVPGPLCLVGLNAADVVRGALHQSLDQGVGLFLEKKSRRRRSSSVNWTRPGTAATQSPLSVTLILLLAVLGRPLFSASRFSGKRALMN